METASRASAVCIVSGTSGPSLTLKAQFSNDKASAQNLLPYYTPAEDSWVDIADAQVSISSDGTYGIPAFDLAYDWIRFVLVVGTADGGTLRVNTRILGWP